MNFLRSINNFENQFREESFRLYRNLCNQQMNNSKVKTYKSFYQEHYEGKHSEHWAIEKDKRRVTNMVTDVKVP